MSQSPPKKLLWATYGELLLLWAKQERLLSLLTAKGISKQEGFPQLFFVILQLKMISHHLPVLFDNVLA